jgi:hypothetical protein
MQRKDAAGLLKNVSAIFSSLFPIAIGLLPKDSNELDPDGVEIHVFALVDEKRLSRLKSILKKRNLKLKKIDEKNMLIIF